MKKYHQLLLLIVSVVSVSLFLVYRHEYNRLHYVLEVFNFFGKPCNFSELQKSDSILSQHDWGPQPLWQETNYGYIYSAFLVDENEAKAIAIQSDVRNVPKNCYFWFEDRKKPTVGKFKFSKIANEESTNAYYYICMLTKVDSVPFAVSFNYKVRRESDMKKIMLTNTMNHSLLVNATICISPSMYSKRRLIEFLSFHKLIGFDNFIFYDKEIPHKMSKFIRNFSRRLGMETAFLPWNYPKTDGPQIRQLVENDCLMRTFGQTKYVVTLEINEYIVPKNALHLDPFFASFDDSTSRLSLPVQKFCIDYSDDQQPIALQNFVVSEDYNYLVRNIYLHAKFEDVVSTNAVDKAQASIHKYIRCNMDPSKTYVDKSMQRFSTNFIRSTLVQSLIHGQL